MWAVSSIHYSFRLFLQFLWLKFKSEMGKFFSLIKKRFFPAWRKNCCGARIEFWLFFADRGIQQIFWRSQNLTDCGFFADLRIRWIFSEYRNLMIFFANLKIRGIFFANLRIRWIFLPVSEFIGFFAVLESDEFFDDLEIRWIFIQFPANCQLDQRKRLDSNLGLKCSESLEYWNIKTMEYWILGILKQWNIKSLEYWNINKMKYWILGILEY